MYEMINVGDAVATPYGPGRVLAIDWHPARGGTMIFKVQLDGHHVPHSYTRKELRRCPHCGAAASSIAPGTTCMKSDCQEAEYHANADRAKPRRRKAVRR